jgi:hypothetical protein
MMDCHLSNLHVVYYHDVAIENAYPPPLPRAVTIVLSVFRYPVQPFRLCVLK